MSTGTPTHIATPVQPGQPGDSAGGAARPAPQPVAHKIIYEQPVNERTRVFLRLEFLFRQAGHHLGCNTEWDSRATLDCVLEIVEIFSNTNLKSEVIKELERHAATLKRLDRNPAVDHDQLATLLKEITLHIDDMHQLNAQIASELKASEFLTSIRQRGAIPGGTCDFDLPAFHYWLQQPAGVRHHDLLHWLGHFDAIGQAIRLILKLTRNSTPLKAAVANGGLYQRTLDAAMPCQLIRIALPADATVYAELSGGRHRFTARFMEFTTADDRARQTDRDIAFELACCVI